MQSKGDIGLNLMICQLLWNLVVSDIRLDKDGQERCDVLTKNEMDELGNLISNRLEQVEMFLHGLEQTEKMTTVESGDNVGEGDEESYQEICTEYVSVAKNLHEKMRTLLAMY